MTLFLLLSCGSGSAKAEDPQSRFLKSVISLSNDFLNVFTSLSDMVGGVLGFDTNTKKSDVGNYFKKVHDTLSSTKEALNKIVADMKSDNNPNASAVETAVTNLVTTTLDKIIEGASEAVKGAEGNEPIGNVAEPAAGAGVAAGSDAVKSLSEGIGKIVEVVLKGKGSAAAGDDKGPVKDADGGAGAARGADGAGADGDARKLFASDNAGDAASAAKVAKDAAKAVGAVTGADILQAIAKGDGGESAKLAKHNNTIANNNGANANNAKDGIIAGAIALRAMAKGGKFANASAAAAGVKDNVISAAVSAVTKALDALTIAIRNTIDAGLKTVKNTMNINSTDTPVTVDNTTSEAKNQ
ncbi:variable large family protein (plasmid) [Borrelia parkeri]|nr:variable large family protein [Borrelia parkeri]